MVEAAGDEATILVVDDTAPLRGLLAAALGTAGHRVIAAPDGRTAMDVAARTPPDVVLLDLALPDVHGLEILDRLKADPRTASAPVVVVTARDEPDVTAEALNRGAHDLVIKPFRMPELLARIEAAVRIKREHDHLLSARATLRSQVDFTEAVMNTIDSVVVVLDREGTIVRFNRAAERLSGYREDELAGMRLWDTPLLPEEERARIEAAYMANVGGAHAAPRLRRVETRWRAQDGGVRVIAWSNTALLDDQGDVAFGVGTGIDITDLREADQRLHACLDVMAASILILDAVRDGTGRVVDLQVRYMNHAAESMLPPVALKAAVDSGSRQFMTQDQFEMVVGVISSGEAVDDEADVVLDGQVFTFAYSLAQLGDGVVLSLRDVTDRKLTQEQLAWTATHDALTGLAGRTLLVDRLHHALTRRRMDHETVVAVLFVDLDGFKAVNDGLGHAAGDDMLVRVARSLEATVRPEDTVARYGGDEFVVVAEGLPAPEEAAVLADRLAAAVAAVSMGGYSLRASVGYAIATAHDDPDAILRLADDMMYEKKRRTR